MQRSLTAFKCKGGNITDDNVPYNFSFFFTMCRSANVQGSIKRSREGFELLGPSVPLASELLAPRAGVQTVHSFQALSGGQESLLALQGLCQQRQMLH